MLHQGKIIAEAPPEEFKRLDDPRVQQFIHGRADGPLSEEAALKPQKSADETGEADAGNEAD
jgi:ABC-type transporter Mla maintaining outer membrane lipid asymmetry ATPase subunit MlaF